MRACNSTLAFQAFVASLVIAAGCSVSVVPLRPPPESKAPLHKPETSTPTPTVALEPIDLDKPLAACEDAAPAPPAEPGNASFVIQNGHDGTIYSVVLSRDGRRVATSAFDGTVRVWDTKTGLLLRRIATGGSSASSVSLSEDGRALAYLPMSDLGGAIHADVIDLEAGKRRSSLGETYGQIALTPEGESLVLASMKVTAFNTTDGRSLFELTSPSSRLLHLALALSPDGKQMATARPDEVAVRDAQTGALIVRHPIQVDIKTTPTWVGFAGASVVMRDATDTVYIYSQKDGVPPLKLAEPHHPLATTRDRIWTTERMSGALVAFSPIDGKPIALPRPGTLHADNVAASSDGSTLALVRTLHQSNPTIEIVDTETMRVIRTLEGKNTAVASIAVSPDGKSISTVSRLGETFARWDLERGALLSSFTNERTGETRSLSYDDSGELLAESSSTWQVRVRDAKTNEARRQFMPYSFSRPKLVAFLPKSRELLTVTDHQVEEKKPAPPRVAPRPGPQKPPPPPTYETLVDRWDVSGPVASPKNPHGEFGKPTAKHVGRIAFRPFEATVSKDGKALAVLGDEGDLAVMLVDQGKVIWSKHFDLTKVWNDKGTYQRNTGFVAFTSNGERLLFSSARLDLVDGIYRYVPVLHVLDAKTGRSIGVHQPGTAGPIAMRGDSVVIGGARPVVLEASTFAERARVSPIDGVIQAVAAHPSRDQFFLGSNAGGTYVVDRQGHALATLISTPNGEHVAVTPEGAYHASLDGARSVAWSFRGPLEGFSFEQLASRFDRKDLVQKRLAGENVDIPLTLSRPPQIDLVGGNPRGGRIETSARSIPLAVNVKSGSRVDHVRAFVDGRPVADARVCAKDARLSLDVPLHAGQNRVSLLSYDALGYASNPLALDVVSTSQLVAKPDLYIVSIGISSYPNMTAEQQLDFADDDARSVTQAFSAFAGEGKPFARLVPLTLLDAEATVDGIDQALASLSRMKPDDLAVVFLAGHGARLGPEKMVFLTRNAAFTRASAQQNGIDWDHIEKTLRKAKGRVLMLLDACHSGHLSTEVVAPNEALAQELASTHRSGVLVFSAARGSQFSYEVPAQGKGSTGRGLELAWADATRAKPAEERALPGGHGLFTSALLEALAGQAPDRDRSGAIEVSELVDYVTERVRAASNGKQTPWVARREMFGEFMVAPPPAR